MSWNNRRENPYQSENERKKLESAQKAAQRAEQARRERGQVPDGQGRDISGIDEATRLGEEIRSQNKLHEMIRSLLSCGCKSIVLCSVTFSVITYLNYESTVDEKPPAPVPALVTATPLPPSLFDQSLGAANPGLNLTDSQTGELEATQLPESYFLGTPSQYWNKKIAEFGNVPALVAALEQNAVKTHSIAESTVETIKHRTVSFLFQKEVGGEYYLCNGYLYESTPHRAVIAPVGHCETIISMRLNYVDTHGNQHRIDSQNVVETYQNGEISLLEVNFSQQNPFPEVVPALLPTISQESEVICARPNQLVDGRDVGLHAFYCGRLLSSTIDGLTGSTATVQTGHYFDGGTSGTPQFDVRGVPVGHLVAKEQFTDSGLAALLSQETIIVQLYTEADIEAFRRAAQTVVFP